MEDTTVDLFCDNDKFCQYVGEFILRIKNSVENNVSLQKDDILRMLELIDTSKFNLNGETVEDKIQSFNSQYINKVREGLSALPKKIYTNEQGVATITPEYNLDSNNHIIPNTNGTLSLAEYINENSLISNLVGNIDLEDGDITVNEKTGEFTSRINGMDYVMSLENDSISLIEIKPVPIDADPKAKFIDEFNKGVQSLVSKLSKEKDITKLSKIQLKRYNNDKIVLDLLMSIDINAVIEELYNPDIMAFEAVEKYAPAEVSRETINRIASRLADIRDSITINNQGNPKMRFVKEFKKKVRFLISNLSKDKDITKLSKIQSVLYIRGKAIVEILLTLDIDTIADDLFDTNVSVSEIIEKYVPREVDFKVIRGVESKLYALRNSLFNEFGI